MVSSRLRYYGARGQLRGSSTFCMGGKGTPYIRGTLIPMIKIPQFVQIKISLTRYNANYCLSQEITKWKINSGLKFKCFMQKKPIPETPDASIVVALRAWIEALAEVLPMWFV